MQSSRGAVANSHTPPPAVPARDGRRPLKVGLLWHSASSGNLGVGALTLANMALVREVAEGLGLTLEFTIVSMRDGEARYVGEDDAAVFVVNSRSLIFPSGCWRVLGAQDCVLDIGAGDSFADIYGAKRFAFLWWTKAIAILRRTPLMLSPQTIGPFTRQPYRWLARLVLARARSVVARDDASLDALTALAPDARAALAVDVAFALPFADRSAERGGARLRVGVNVSGLLFNEAETGRNRFGLSVDYARLMRRFLAALSARPDVEVHLISHVSSAATPNDDDGRVANRLQAEFPDAICVPAFEGPCEAKSYISSLDFLVAGRMHACIAAFSSGVPVAPVAYSRKFSGLFGMLGYPWLVPVSGLGEDEALAFLIDCLQRRSVLADDVATGMAKVDGLLDVYKAELAKVLREAAGAVR